MHSIEWIFFSFKDEPFVKQLHRSSWLGFEALNNQKWAYDSQVKNSKYLTSFCKQRLRLYINSDHYSIIIIFIRSFKKIINKLRTKSPRPSRMPLPIPVEVSNTGINHVSERVLFLKNWWG